MKALQFKENMISCPSIFIDVRDAKKEKAMFAENVKML
jgi:hypothetical protein